MEQIKYNRRHDIKINSLQTREINLLLSFSFSLSSFSCCFSFYTSNTFEKGERFQFYKNSFKNFSKSFCETSSLLIKKFFPSILKAAKYTSL